MAQPEIQEFKPYILNQLKEIETPTTSFFTFVKKQVLHGSLSMST